MGVVVTLYDEEILLPVIRGARRLEDWHGTTPGTGRPEAADRIARGGECAELAAVFDRVATWQLAKIVHDYGKRAMTDVLRQLAADLDHLDDLERARREADEAKAAGRLPQ